ncbi:hypothetical protein LBMAG42_20810 [Deltaproteobacteria bacterium]|nr:hypothetical protein LBMAG42_20810 [Deltaproteobacteria bacterium]
MLMFLITLGGCAGGGGLFADNVPDDSCFDESPSTLNITVVADREDIEASELFVSIWTCFEGGEPDIPVTLDGTTQIDAGNAGELTVFVAGTWSSGGDTGDLGGECGGSADVTVEPNGVADVTVTVDCTETTDE